MERITLTKIMIKIRRITGREVEVGLGENKRKTNNNKKTKKKKEKKQQQQQHLYKKQLQVRS